MAKFIINNLRLSLEDDISALKKVVSNKLRVPADEILDFKIVKESIDARKKPYVTLVYSVVATIDGSRNVPSDADIKPLEETIEEKLDPGILPLKSRPIIVGSGPAGLFAGLTLAQNGYKPIIIERGESVEKRSRIVAEYWKNGILDTETNVQFGEGGAGTFSDGKLTTRINDTRCDKVLKEFYSCGAHEDILYKAKPHIGSDVLKTVVANMRRRIEEYGGEIRFNSKLTSLKLMNGGICGIVVNGNEEIDADVVVLAIGHSARDTFEALLKDGISFVQKPFSIGVRIEHSQELINTAQYGNAANHPKLGAAEYQLFNKTGDRTAYSFCMCPGGVVVASASELGMIVTNGMSQFARNMENANSALVVSVGPGDFGGNHPLLGIEFQRSWERHAFNAGGGNNAAPVQRLGDFVYGNISKEFGDVKPSYTGETRFADLNKCLPGFVTAAIKQSLRDFDRRVKGFAMKDAILTGVETRTSSPVRIPRTQSFEALGVNGLYPAGEGAGYAGGIVSAAVDGIRIAEQIVRTYDNKK